MNKFDYFRIGSLLFLLNLIVGCSGGETGTGGLENPAPIPTDEITTSVGRITSLDGVSVNGVKYNTDNSSVTLDGELGSTSNLEIGMVVAVQGKISDNQLMGDAVHIEYRDVLEGIVIATNLNSDGIGILNILGQTVIVDLLTVFDSDEESEITDLNQIVNGNVIEVSGFTSGYGTIYATRIELKDENYETGHEIEVKGVVSNLTDTEFYIGQLQINYTNAQQMEFMADGLSEGQLVQVSSIVGLDAKGKFIADAVILQGNGNTGFQMNEGENILLEGVVTTLITVEQEFILNGQLILINGTTNVVNGIANEIVEEKVLVVEGYINASGAVVAQRILFLGKVDIAMRGFVESIDIENNSLIVFGTIIFVDNFTTIKDRRNKDGFIVV